MKLTRPLMLCVVVWLTVSCRHTADRTFSVVRAVKASYVADVPSVPWEVRDFPELSDGVLALAVVRYCEVSRLPSCGDLDWHPAFAELTPPPGAKPEWEDDRVALLSALVHSDPRYRKPEILAAFALSALGSEHALMLAEEWASVDPDNSLPHYLMADGFLGQGKWEHALSAFQAGTALQKCRLYPSWEILDLAGELSACERAAARSRLSMLPVALLRTLPTRLSEPGNDGIRRTSIPVSADIVRFGDSISLTQPPDGVAFLTGLAVSMSLPSANEETSPLPIRRPRGMIRERQRLYRTYAAAFRDAAHRTEQEQLVIKHQALLRETISREERF